jgi:hypothetical protein
VEEKKHLNSSELSSSREQASFFWLSSCCQLQDVKPPKISGFFFGGAAAAKSGTVDTIFFPSSRLRLATRSHTRKSSTAVEEEFAGTKEKQKRVLQGKRKVLLVG